MVSFNNHFADFNNKFFVDKSYSTCFTLTIRLLASNVGTPNKNKVPDLLPIKETSTPNLSLAANNRNFWTMIKSLPTTNFSFDKIDGNYNNK